ncbi:MAG: alpha/beta hydrolase, partial [Comamonadaceae bacterium]
PEPACASVSRRSSALTSALRAPCPWVFGATCSVSTVSFRAEPSGVLPQAMLRWGTPNTFIRLRKKMPVLAGAWPRVDPLDPAFADWTLKEVLPRIACPVLAIHGEKDEFGSTLHADLIAERAGKGPASIEVMPGCGHVPHREDPEWVSALISAFLAGALPR